MSSSPYSIGIDVSKAKLDAAVITSGDRKVILECQAENSPAACRELAERLRPYAGSTVVIEATAGYHYAPAFALRDAGFRVKVINPIITGKFASSGIRKTKTDRVDALLLAKIGILEPGLADWTEDERQIRLKQLSKAIAGLKAQRRSLFQKANHLESLGEAGNGEAVRSFEAVMKTLGKEIKKLSGKLAGLAAAEVKTISSIIGVGEGSAAVIAAELGDITRFAGKRQAVAFSGLDPSVRESGTSVKGRSRISKRGSGVLRHALFMGAWGLMMHNPNFKAFYEKKKAEGKHYFAILCAMARKLLILIYTMLKNNTLYDPIKFA
jgi:transposase